MPTREEILKALEAVIDPELRESIVELGMVREIQIGDDKVHVTVSLTTAGCPIRNHFETAVATAVRDLGVASVSVDFDVLSDSEKSDLQRKLGGGPLPTGALARVANVVCVGSGKGGVGKSTITANLAAALASDGKKVGVLDADVWGYSIPRMFGLGLRSPAGLRRSQDPPDRVKRREDHVDRLLRRGGRGRRLARADAAQGADPVPRGRRLGRA